ncbi:hypothetical protein ARMGADRAFT_175657 [Armillaria gallica]|uniref:Uncharacterized protein n=1 Tax=Armillaria gallica TaxID=47427 RepID=A0A2H3CSX0_ARMGA|nr:hypothetical protein ARMGADRAFT_175657 [Armillaria gallica]
MSHPPIYLIDFEAAPEYSPDHPWMTSCSLYSSFPDVSAYSRPRAPDKPYSSFNPDISQFGLSSCCEDAPFVTVSAEHVDHVLAELVCEDSVSRPSAHRW